MITVQWKVTKQFFDKKSVTDAVGKAEARVMNRAGSRVRLIMRRSLKRSKKKSSAGEPPRIHAKGFSLKTILYAYNKNGRNVIIGPVGRAGSNVPNTLEFGGTVKISRKRRRNGKKVIVKDTATIDARPFAGPAEANYRDSYPDEWKGAL